jgi:uncharacterized membrane protein
MQCYFYISMFVGLMYQKSILLPKPANQECCTVLCALVVIWSYNMLRYYTLLKFSLFAVKKNTETVCDTSHCKDYIIYLLQCTV